MWSSALALFLIGASPSGDVGVAARAFAQGQAAQVAGRHRDAAEKFELADFIVPSDAALKSAARARLRAGDLTAAAGHADALTKRCTTKSCRRLAKKILARTEGKLTKVMITCTEPCTPLVDAKVVTMKPSTTHVTYVLPGEHALEVDFDKTRSARQTLNAEKGAVARANFVPPVVPPTEPEPTVRLEPPSRPPPDAALTITAPIIAPAPERGGLPPWVVIVGAGLTATATGLTVWSGLDTRAAYGNYRVAPTAAAFDDGRAKRNRTNVLLGASAVVGAATVVVALFATDWGADP